MPHIDYFVNHGPDYSHMGLNVVHCKTLRAARRYVDGLDTMNPNSRYWKIVRVQTPVGKMQVAERSDIIAGNHPKHRECFSHDSSTWISEI